MLPIDMYIKYQINNISTGESLQNHCILARKYMSLFPKDLKI